MGGEDRRRKGAKMKTGEKRGEERFFTFLFTSMAPQVVTKWIFHSQIIECKIKELKLLHLNTQSHYFFFFFFLKKICFLFMSQLKISYLLSLMFLAFLILCFYLFLSMLGIICSFKNFPAINSLNICSLSFITFNLLKLLLNLHWVNLTYLCFYGFFFLILFYF